MDYLISENQLNKLINELSPKSSGVEEFIEKIKETPGVLKHLGFSSIKSLKDFITDNDYEDFQELKDDLESFLKKTKKTKK